MGGFAMRDETKVIHYPYYCKKCTRTVYYAEGEEQIDICKFCKNKMEAWKPHISHTDFTLKNVQKKMEPVRYNKSTTVSQPNVPTCPTCHSTNVRRMSGLETGASIIVLGIFSRKINKTFQCNNCKCTW